jgi:hypothetical protein
MNVFKRTRTSRFPSEKGKSGKDAPFFQAKLTVNSPGDEYEQEADATAEQVMQMSSSLSFFKPALPSVQKKCRQCEDDEKVHRKETGAKEEGTSSSFDRYVSSLDASGEPLPESTRQFFEPRFGKDFSDVRLHRDAKAASSAQSIQALAYTSGSNIVFNAGQYAPESTEGKKLLAHELTHVVQQKKAPSIQRKIKIGDTVMTVDEQYKKTVKDAFGDVGLKIMLSLHNDGNDPVYQFNNWEEYRTELRVRSNAIKGMEIANMGGPNKCCDYPSTHPEGYLDPAYWNRLGNKHFEAKNPLPKGKEASDAVEAIFQPGAGTQLECMTMAIAIEYYSFMKGVGKEKFNKLYHGGFGLVIANSGPALLKTILNPPLLEESKKEMSELLPGDYAYFKNFKDYGDKHPDGLWQGESVIYYGDNKFRGFGIAELDTEGILKELVKAYNEGLPEKDKKTVEALKAEGGGFTGWVNRPVVSEALN